MAPAPSWLPIIRLRCRFESNINALTVRYPEVADALLRLVPKTEYHFLTTDRIVVGAKNGPQVEALPGMWPPTTAVEIAKKCYPTGKLDRAIVVAGEDVGWLWNCLYQYPCDFSKAAGHRAPLYFLMRDLERLWVILHVQDWHNLLTDPRVRLFTGDNAFADFQASLPRNVQIPWPKISISGDKTLWPQDMNVNVLTQAALVDTRKRMTEAQAQLRVHSDLFTPESIAQRYRSGQPLKVLGIVSRYTSFIQHSMRDWLEGFASHGHQTELSVESGDHELPCDLSIAQTCATFKPDLIVMIDHFRNDSPGFPKGVPSVMWVQDGMSHIYSPAAGKGQGPRDYVLGFAYEKLRLVHEMGYPADRYLPTTIGVNPRRFAPRPADDPELAQYACDVCFVTHASKPAEEYIHEEIARNNQPMATRLLSTIFEKLRAIYDSGSAIVAPSAMRRVIDQGLTDCRTRPNPELNQQLMHFFYMKVNNALFRHQSLKWLVELGVDLRLYGKGWEKNPSFKRFARGEAEHQGQLALIYQASRINLQISPMGSLHQRVMEGLSSGGFFLMRRGDGDIIGRHYAKLFNYCQTTGITTDQQLRACTEEQIQETLRQTIQIHNCDPFAERYRFMDLLKTMHDCDYLCSAGCLWGDDFDQASFASKSELQERVTHFLNNPAERQRLTASMLKPVLERFTYEKTASRLIEFIASDQAKQAIVQRAPTIQQAA